MSENQKLREALQLIAWSNDSKWQADCARQALALPTSAPVGELPELPEPYRALDKHLSHPILRQVLFAPGEYFTTDQMRAYARAALSAGDAVDAQVIALEALSLPTQADPVEGGEVVEGWKLLRLPNGHIQATMPNRDTWTFTPDHRPGDTAWFTYRLLDSLLTI